MAAAAPACGVLDLSCHVAGAVDSWFTSLVTSAVSPLFALIGRTLLTTPQAGQFATVRQIASLPGQRNDGHDDPD